MRCLELARRRATSGVILDTNVFLVFLVGSWNPTEIPKSKRTSAYTAEDYELLLAIVTKVGKLVTTPHILTEVCNLADTLNRKYNYALYQQLADIQTSFYAYERRQEATRLMANPLFKSFGIADTSLIDASKCHLVVTDEAACHNVISKAGGRVINLNHLRGKIWIP